MACRICPAIPCWRSAMIMAAGVSGIAGRASSGSACPRASLPGVTVKAMTYPLTAAQANLAELVAEARRTHRPVTISEHGRPVAAPINVDDLADLADRAALAAHLADKAGGRGGIGLEDLDTALDRIDAERLW